MSVRISVNAAAILDSRGLGGSTAARRRLASTVARLCGPYAPMSAGSGAHMKDQTQITESGGAVAIVYAAPYAHYQYKGEVMAGRARHRLFRSVPAAGGGGERQRVPDRRSL